MGTTIKTLKAAVSALNTSTVGQGLQVQVFTATAAQTSFALSWAPSSVTNLLILIDGTRVNSGYTFTLAGSTLTVSPGLDLNMVLTVVGGAGIIAGADAVTLSGVAASGFIQTSALTATAPGANSGSAAAGSSTNVARLDHNHGDAGSLKSATTSVSVSAATAPTAGQHLVATSTTAATWQDVVAKALGTTGASVNVASAAPGVTGQVLMLTSATTATWQTLAATVSVAILVDRKAHGTIGKAFSATTWTDADLNTEISDANNLVSISGNAFTPIAGTYLVEWRLPFASSQTYGKTRLYNSTGAAVVEYGDNVQGNGANGYILGCGSAIITANGTTAYKIQGFNANSGNFGMYLSDQFATHGVPDEQYTNIKLTKIG